MKNVCLIGYGYWGKIIHKSLREINSIKKIFIIKGRKTKSNINFNNIDWVIITANTNNHFKLVKKYLNLKINVFCEKPLTLKLKDDLELYKIAKRNNCKIYVSDVENYKNKRLSILKNNLIYRSKFSDFKKDIIYRLAYHEFTYLFKYFNSLSNIQIKDIESSEGLLKFNLQNNNKIFSFSYDLNKRKKKHKFNNINLISKKNVLKVMLSNVINEKANFSENKRISLFAQSMCLKVLKKLKA